MNLEYFAGNTLVQLFPRATQEHIYKALKHDLFLSGVVAHACYVVAHACNSIIRETEVGPQQEILGHIGSMW